MRNLNWSALRPLRGSQQTAFEELCCQLAAFDCPEPSGFRRVGVPDGGVECYFVSADGDESGWQAKFFERTPDAQRWAQLDRSVKRALDTHPRLVSYTICLPLNRSDSRDSTEQSFMNRWDERVLKWTGWVNAMGRTVAFPYWGETELFERLSRREHEGRARFWFDRELFGPTWLRSRLDEALANTQPRYPAPVHIDVAQMQNFDALLRHERFSAILSRLLEASDVDFAKVRDPKPPIAIADQEALGVAVGKLKVLALAHPRSATVQIPVAEATIFAADAVRACYRIIDAIDDARQKGEAATKQAAARTKKSSRSRGMKATDVAAPARSADYSAERYRFSRIRSAFEELVTYLRSTEASLANAAALLVLGEWGMGKTELLRDAVRGAVDSGKIAVLLAGKQFNAVDEPWRQMWERLQTTFDGSEEFLGALSAAAEASGQRALLAIDALNEGDGPRLWPGYLAGMISTLRRYPWIAMTWSLRSNYEELLIPPNIDASVMPRIETFGFRGREYDATQAFFTHFVITPPSAPLLVPEFSNPLFLMLFCEGLHRRDLHEVPDGLEGVESVFSFFMDAVNDAISLRLGWDRNRKLVQQAAQRIAHRMSEIGEQRLPVEEGRDLVNLGLPIVPDDRSLYRAMCDEGLFVEDVVRRTTGPQIFVGFVYNRLADHEIVKHLLATHLNPADLAGSFAPESPLGRLVQNPRTAWLRVGEVEALLIQLPELVGDELLDVQTQLAEFPQVRHAFLRSLVWRRASTITPRTVELARACARVSRGDVELLFSTLLMLAPRPQHRLNAGYLHEMLAAADLSLRDAVWTPWIASDYDDSEASLVHRLLEWAERHEQHAVADEGTAGLIATAVGWFLTSSNRQIRDRATKALVRLLDSFNLSKQLLEAFSNVNDPYVVERVYGVAAGAALRTNDVQLLGALANAVYALIFKDGEPPPHLLLRDYARAIVEAAAHAGATLDFALARVRPPYRSTWPGMEVRTAAELAPQIPLDRIRERRAESILHSSVLGGGDFARYIIGTNTPHFEWIDVPIGDPLPATRAQLVERFKKTLTRRQRNALARLESAELADSMTRHSRSATRELRTTRKAIRKPMANATVALRSTLGARKWKEFDVDFERRLQGGREPWEFDLEIVQRWVYERVLKFGWTPRLFGQIDDQMSYTRESRRLERIGKKYQWIALHECLARISDNFRFRGRSWKLRNVRYDGPQQLWHGRDIDPSLLLGSTLGLSGFDDSNDAWWVPSPPVWIPEKEREWIRDAAAIPTLRQIVFVRDPGDKSEWLCVDGSFQWHSTPFRSTDDDESVGRRQQWVRVRAYAVRREHSADLRQWAGQRSLPDLRLPGHDSSFSGVFLGEYPWAPAYAHVRSDDPLDGWEQIDGAPAPVRAIADYYGAGSEYDQSVSERFSIAVPAKWLIDLMGLDWRAHEGYWFSRSGLLVAQDPSVRARGPSTLLLRADGLPEFLEANGLELTWVMQGERTLLGSRSYFDVHDYPGDLQITGAANLGPPWTGSTTAVFFTLKELQSRNARDTPNPTGECLLRRDEERSANPSILGRSESSGTKG